MAAEPAAEHLPRTSFHCEARGVRIPERSINEVRGALDPGESLSSRRGAERIEPAGRAEENHDEREEESEDGEKHAAQPCSGQEGH